MSHFLFTIRLRGMERKNNIDPFICNKALLISISYRMLGSFAEAEEIVQETALEWLGTGQDLIENPQSWLVRVVTNKSLDTLKRAYKRREVYTGTWLPEVLPDSLITWDYNIENKESLHTSFLILLENLNPKERAVFILRNVVEYSFKEIADFVGTSDSTARKIYERATKKVQERKEKFDTYDSSSLNVIRDFFEASCLGEEGSIRELLDEESQFWSDGGGIVSAIRVVICDMRKISRFFSNTFSRADDSVDRKVEFTFVNHLPGLIISKFNENNRWEIETLFSFELKNGVIARIYAQRNPEKIHC